MSLPEVPQRRGRRRFLLVASLFFVPLAAAMILYFYAGWRPPVGAHGELIDPPRTLVVAGLAQPDGNPAPANVFEGKWSLVLDAGAACGPETLARLDELGRVRLALDKDTERVRRVLLHPGSCDPARLPPEPDLVVLTVAAGAGQAFLAQFPPALEAGQGIYIVDPHGNLMMGYPVVGSARGLLKDLERLLRLSSIG